MIVPKAKRQQSGLYAVRLRVNGRTVTVRATTETACLRQARLVKAQLQAEPKADAGTVGAVVDRYINKYAPQLSPSTLRAYKSYRRNRFKSCMGAFPDRVDWQQAINAEGVSPKTVRNAWGLVSAALKDANYPVPRVMLPTLPPTDLPFLQPEEIRPFMDALRGKPYELPVLMELHGLRYSEVCAMTWDKITDETITVSGAVVRGEEGIVAKPTNKTAKSTRTIPLLIPRILELRGQEFYKDNANLQRDIQRVCKTANVTMITNHSLRRTFASLCWYLQIDPLQTAEWGGWSNVQTVLKIYTKLSQGSRNASADKVRGFFATENGTKF